MSNTQGIVGTDNIMPIETTDGLWRTWSLSQLYLGQEGDGKYIGKVDDYVINPATDQKWKITMIDPTTLIPTLKSITPVIVGSDDTTDLLYSPLVGTYAETYRCIIDKSVLPYRLTVDQRCTINSVLTKYAKIFQGSLLDGTAKVISAFYDAGGQFLGDNVPLELVREPNGVNYSVKTVMPCYTKAELAPGDAVTVVFYNDEGGEVSQRQLRVTEGSFMQQTDTAMKFVAGITLESPWLSESNPNELRYPLNLPLESLDLFGKVHYSDGSALRMPVDGTKFQIFGFKEYAATIVGQPVPLVLRYNYSPDEITYDAQTATPDGAPFKTESYQAITMNQDGAYTLKLYCAPTWNATVNQWRLQWYLYNLDRDTCINVTPYIEYADNHPAFDPSPSAYGLNQAIQVNLDLSKVNGVYRKVNFTQTLSIVLYRNATDHSGTAFAIYYDPAQNPPYGLGLVGKVTFVNQNLKYVNIGLGLTDQAAWLAKTLAAARPLYDTREEPSYPDANMFAFLWSDGSQTEFPLSQWNQDCQVSQAVPDGGTVLVKFFNRTPETDIEIALCPMVLQVQ